MFEFARRSGEAVHDNGSAKAAACQELITRTEFAAIYIGSEDLGVSQPNHKNRTFMVVKSFRQPSALDPSTPSKTNRPNSTFRIFTLRFIKRADHILI